jgi:hypothetical protein
MKMKRHLINGILIFTIVFFSTSSHGPPKEHFFISKHQPKYLSVNLTVARIVIWYPWPFISVSLGWMLDDASKLKVLQMYFGIKCDGTRTAMLGGPPSFAMVLTPKELAAFRINEIDRVPVWNNQGGS